MKPVVSAPSRNATGAISNSEFVEGRPYKHWDGTLVEFRSDTWILQVAHGTKGMTRANFAQFPEWLRTHAKRLVARKWLVEGKSLSILTQTMTDMRRLSRAIPGFSGPTLADLTTQHLDQLYQWLSERYRLGREAAHAASAKKGRELAPRELRAVQREVGGLGPRSIASTIATLNALLESVEKYGPGSHLRARVPRDLRVSSPRVGGAAPAKILTEVEVAAVLEAAQADIDEFEYLSGCVLALEPAISALEQLPPVTTAYRRLAKYLGLGGHEPISLPQIAKEEGVTHLRGQTLKSFLADAIGRDKADQIWDLRRKLRSTGERVTPEERDKAKASLRVCLEGVSAANFRDPRHTRYFRAVRLYFGLGNTRLHSIREAAEASGVDPDWLKRYVGKGGGLSDAIDAELYNLARDARTRLPLAHRRAIKATATRLLAVTSRRIDAFLRSLLAEPEAGWTTHRGAKVFAIKFRAFKSWGPNGLPEQVKLPGYYGQVAEEAIELAKRLTAVLREEAPPDDGRHLFIYHNDQGINLGVRTLTSKALHMYLHSHRGDGLLVRRSVPRAEEITAHWFRHVAGQEITTKTGSPAYSARFLGNSIQHAATAYFSMGTIEARQQAQSLFREGKVSGHLFDAMARLKMEADGALDHDLPASQLTVEEALQRLKDNPGFLWDYTQGEEEVTVDSVDRYLQSGLVVNLTSRGACILPVSEGPCPASDECPIGCDPKANEVNPGCGCRWQVQVPHDQAIETLNSDLESIEHQLSSLSSDSSYGAWSSHLQQRQAIWQVQLERLYALRDGLG